MKPCTLNRSIFGDIPKWVGLQWDSREQNQGYRFSPIESNASRGCESEGEAVNPTNMSNLILHNQTVNQLEA
jgi:hypothetical protein